jgi:hypothetical protein
MILLVCTYRCLPTYCYDFFKDYKNPGQSCLGYVQGSNERVSDVVIRERDGELG